MENQDADGRRRLEELLLEEPRAESRLAQMARMGAEIALVG